MKSFIVGFLACAFSVVSIECKAQTMFTADAAITQAESDEYDALADASGLGYFNGTLWDRIQQATWDLDWGASYYQYQGTYDDIDGYIAYATADYIYADGLLDDAMEAYYDGQHHLMLARAEFDASDWAGACLEAAAASADFATSQAISDSAMDYYDAGVINIVGAEDLL